MDDNYFDKKLKGILESPPDYLPQDADINGMRNRLSGLQPLEEKKNWWPILFFLLLFPLMFTSGYLYFSHEKLKIEIAEIKNLEIEKAYQIDTIINKHVVYHYDTIYNVIYKEKHIISEKRTIPNNSNLLYLSTKSTNRINTSKFYSGWNNNKPGLSLLNELPSSSLLKKTNSIHSSPELYVNKKIENLATLPIEKITPTKKKKHGLNTTEKELIPSKKKIKPIAYFTPTGMSISGNYSPYINADNKHSNGNIRYGIEGEIDLPKGRSITIGIEHLIHQFEFKDIANLPDLPAAEPNKPSDILHEVKVNYSNLQIPFSIRHKFLKNKNVQPVLTTGIVAAIPLKQKYKYEYLDGPTEYGTNTTSNTGSLSFDNLRLGIGAKYSFLKNLSILPEIIYQHSLSQSGVIPLSLNFWSLNIGVNYKL